MYKVTVTDSWNDKGKLFLYVKAPDKGRLPEVNHEIGDETGAWKVLSRQAFHPPLALLHVIRGRGTKELPEVERELSYQYPPSPGEAPQEVKIPIELKPPHTASTVNVYLEPVTVLAAAPESGFRVLAISDMRYRAGRTTQTITIYGAGEIALDEIYKSDSGEWKVTGTGRRSSDVSGSGSWYVKNKTGFAEYHTPWLHEVILKSMGKTITPELNEVLVRMQELKTEKPEKQEEPHDGESAAD